MKITCKRGEQKFLLHPGQMYCRISSLFSAGIFGRVAVLGIGQQDPLPFTLDWGVDGVLSAKYCSVPKAEMGGQPPEHSL